MLRDKKQFLFKKVSDVQRLKLLMDEEAMYSTTDQITAEKIANNILEIVDKSALIIDATACIGGSVLALNSIFENVIAIEKDSIKYQYLVHNMQVLGINNVKCIHADLITECRNYKSDVIFIDPPWGGPEYKALDKIDLFISEKKLSEVCNNIAKDNCTKYIVLKVPVNFNDEKFIQETKEQLSLHTKNTKLRKMHLLIFKTLYTNEDFKHRLSI